MLLQKIMCVVLAFHEVARAAVLRLPLFDTETSISDDTAFFSYGLNITVGTPPQTIKVLLDVDHSTLFVQSSRCQSSLCRNSNGSVFNSSVSSTYIAKDQKFELVYANAWVRGKLAQDIVNVNGIDVEGVTFLDATDIYPRTFIDWYVDYHGVLGLAPGYTNPTPDIPSTWESIVDKGLLERNVFAISPPTGLRYLDRPRTNGELILGSLPSNLDEILPIKLPMKFGTYAWATSLETMTFGNFTATFSSGIAVFSTAYPFISVPYGFGRELLQRVELGPDFGFFRSIPCEHRSSLPNWTFGIGGQTIVLNPFQYTFEATSSWMNETACVLALEKSNSNDGIGLGWAFWQNYETLAFDQDDLSILLYP